MRWSASKRLSVETHVGGTSTRSSTGSRQADQVYDVGKLKWRIAHPGNGQPSDAQLARAKALGIGWALTIAPVQDGGTGPRFRTTMENSAQMCLMTDAMNVAPWPPFLSLFFVTTGQTLLPGDEGVPPEERLTRMEALRSYTTDCAWFLDLDGKVGSLEPGHARRPDRPGQGLLHGPGQRDLEDPVAPDGRRRTQSSTAPASTQASTRTQTENANRNGPPQQGRLVRFRSLDTAAPRADTRVV